MARKLYTYNPETDNFERFYPSIRDRAGMLTAILFIGLVLGIGVYFLIYSSMEKTELENLSNRNHELRQQYAELDSQINYSMAIMREIQERDLNFYRVILQMEEGMEVPDSVIPTHNVMLTNMDDRILATRLAEKLDTLDLMMLRQAISFNRIRDEVQNDKHKLDHIPAVLPINIKDYTMSSGYGVRIDPVYKSRKFHAGLDFAASAGTEVFATADGKVSFAGTKGGYGNTVDINHGYNYTTRYAHLSKILVPEGKEVKRGELIGHVGSTGKSTGPHLHYEVRFKGEPQNPVNYYFMDLGPEEYEEMIELAEKAGHVMD